MVDPQAVPFMLIIAALFLLSLKLCSTGQHWPK